MRMADLPRASRSIVVGLAVLLPGCATSSATKAPSLPQLPSPPSVPSPPQTQPGSASGTKAEAQGEKKGEAGAKSEAKAKGETGKQGQEGDAAKKAEATSKGTPGDKGEKAEAQGRGQGATGGGRSGAAAGTGTATGGAGTGGAKTPDEQRDALDGKLQTSMADFDGMLLKEQKALEDKQRKDPLPERGGGTGTEGPGDSGAGKAGSTGSKDDRTPAERRAEAEDQAAAKQGQAGDKGSKDAPTADTATGSSTDAGRLEGGTPVTAPVEGGPAGPGPQSPAVPPDVGDGKNDDVVARQLREAATSEKDPAIREKLWEEYREYKKSAGKGGN